MIPIGFKLSLLQLRLQSWAVIWPDDLFFDKKISLPVYFRMNQSYASLGLSLVLLSTAHIGFLFTQSREAYVKHVCWTSYLLSIEIFKKMVTGLLVAMQCDTVYTVYYWNAQRCTTRYPAIKFHLVWCWSSLESMDQFPRHWIMVTPD